jgi:hypothetical protein
VYNGIVFSIRVRASRVSPSAVAEEDDSEDIDEYADKVAGLQSNEQTAVDVPVSFTHNQCNLSMIMEQSYSELELSICNAIGNILMFRYRHS